MKLNICKEAQIALDLRFKIWRVSKNDYEFSIWRDSGERGQSGTVYSISFKFREDAEKEWEIQAKRVVKWRQVRLPNT